MYRLRTSSDTDERELRPDPHEPSPELVPRSESRCRDSAAVLDGDPLRAGARPDSRAARTSSRRGLRLPAAAAWSQAARQPSTNNRGGRCAGSPRPAHATSRRLPARARRSGDAHALALHVGRSGPAPPPSCSSFLVSAGACRPSCVFESRLTKVRLAEEDAVARGASASAQGRAERTPRAVIVPSSHGTRVRPLHARGRRDWTSCRG